jgi:hypothetical protein
VRHGIDVFSKMPAIFEVQAMDEPYNTPRILVKCRKRCSTPMEINRLLQELHRVRGTPDLQTHTSICSLKTTPPRKGEEVHPNV